MTKREWCEFIQFMAGVLMVGIAVCAWIWWRATT